MTIALKTHKLLWGSSGNICARCKRGLVEDATETDDESLVGQEAHIVSKKEDGPRYSDPVPMAQRDLCTNLILLCSVCHKIIDDQIDTYSADLLRKMKADHEQEVKEKLGKKDLDKWRDDLMYSSCVDEWAVRARVEKWIDWSYGMLSHGRPRLLVDNAKLLDELVLWMLGRVWPGRYPNLEAAFHNFRWVLSDLLNTFYQHAEVVGNGTLFMTDGYNLKWSQ